MSIINFTVQFDVLANREDGSDSGLDTDLIPLSGPVIFTPLTVDNKLVSAKQLSPRAAGLKLRPQAAVLDANGRLKPAEGGVLGVRLWANDPVLELDGPLVYRVDFQLTTPVGQPVRVDPGFFEAPASDVTVQLADVLEPTLTAAAGASALVGGSFVNDTVVFVNADGSSLSPIDVPEGFLVLLDNGDSTWSVGPGGGS